ncbi:MAG: hypothetical protein AB7I18_06725 [Candidatus Berkiella sp.]
MLSGPYSLVEVNHILAITESLLDCDEKMLLKLPHDSEMAALFDEKCRDQLSQSCDLKALIKLADTTLVELFVTRPFNRNHLLAHLFTSYFQKGLVINTDSLSQVAAWHILHACVKELRSAPRMTNDAVEGVFLGFIGQLIKNHHGETAKAIHQLLYLGQKIAASKACGMGTTNTARIIGGTLLQGLKLIGRIAPEELAQEFNLMADVSEVLLTHKLFTRPFDPENYAKWSLSKGPFFSIQAAIVGQLGDPSARSLFTLYPEEMVGAQARLANVVQSGSLGPSASAATSSKEVRFSSDSDQDVEAISTRMASFSLVSPRTLATQYEMKRNKGVEDNEKKGDKKEEGKKKRRATLSEGSKKK